VALVSAGFRRSWKSRFRGTRILAEAMCSRSASETISANPYFDFGSDVLPALALGAEPTTHRLLRTPRPGRHLLDRSVLARAFREDIKPSPAVHSKIADSIRLVQMIQARLRG
jgi:hypothetical protein